MNGDHRDHLDLPPMDANVGLRVFDAQPLWMKELLWYSSLNLVLDVLAPPEPLQCWIDELRRLEREYAAGVWPAEHPANSEP